MKCAVDFVIKEKRRQDILDTLREVFLRFFDVSAGHILHSELGHGQKRLYSFYSGSATSLNRTLEKFKGENDCDFESVEMSHYVYAKWLKELGVDIEEIEKSLCDEMIDKFNSLTSSQKQIRYHRNRQTFINGAKMAMETYYMSALWFLHEKYGYGAGRLPAIYIKMRRLYNTFVQTYLMCDPNTDISCNLMIDGFEIELEKAGIYFNGKPRLRC